MKLKYIILAILKILFVLGLCNYKFSFKILKITLPTPLPQQYNPTHASTRVTDLIRIKNITQHAKTFC